MRLFEDFSSNFIDKWLLVNYVSANMNDQKFNYLEGGIEYTISILYDKDKRDYLSNIKKWQKDSYFFEKVGEKRVPEPLTAFEEVWEDLIADLKPDKNLYLNEIPTLEVHCIDQIDFLGYEKTLIKGELDELKNIEGYILVNYIQVDFGKEISSDEKSKFNWSNSWSPCPVKNYYIKSKAAILNGAEKKQYLERVENLQSKYVSARERFDSRQNCEDDFHTEVKTIWDALKPDKSMIESMPFLDIHNWDLDELNPNALKIEIKGEINHRWEFPIDECPMPDWL